MNTHFHSGIGNNLPRLRDRRCAVLRRASSTGQTTSLDNHGRTDDQLQKEANLTVAAERKLFGVTGSVPGARTDVDEIIALKHRGGPQGDFDLLVVPDATRFTRAGQVHGMKLVYDLRAAGIDLYCCAEDLLVDGELAVSYFGMLLLASNQTVRAISRGSTAGSTASFLDGRSPHCSKAPYGLDRLYTDADGKPLHIIRNLADGSQQMLDPDTGEVTRTFPPNDPEQGRRHYTRQKNERCRLVPGDPRRLAVLLWMFELRYARHLAGNAIAKLLNDRGIGSPTGKLWHSDVVRDMLVNPVYIGQGIRNRLGTGLFNVSGNATNGGQPLPSDVSFAETATQKRPTNRRRRREDWIEQPYEHLVDLLPAHVRDAAREAVDASLDRAASADPLPVPRDRHFDSEYVLKGLLTCQPGGYAMTGRTTGGKYSTRYYTVSRARTAPRTKDATLRRFVLAEDLERQVLEQLRAALSDREMLTAAATEAYTRLKEQHATQAGNTSALRRRITKLRTAIANLDTVLLGDEEHEQDSVADPVATRRLQLVEQLRIAQAKLRAAGSSAAKLPTDTRLAVARLVAEIEKRVATLPENPTPEDGPRIRALLAVFCPRLVVDLETRTVHGEFALPLHVVTAMATGNAVLPGHVPKLCLDAGSPSQNPHEAQDANTVPLANIRCTYIRRDRGAQLPCYACRRRPATD